MIKPIPSVCCLHVIYRESGTVNKRTVQAHRKKKKEYYAKKKKKKAKNPVQDNFGKVWAKHVDASSYFKTCFSSIKTKLLTNQT